MSLPCLSQRYPLAGPRLRAPGGAHGLQVVGRAPERPRPLTALEPRARAAHGARPQPRPGANKAHHGASAPGAVV